MDLKDLKLDQWWKLMAVAGAAVAIASAPAGFAAGFLVGLGLLLFGVGEWSMIRKYEEPSPATFGMPAAVRWVLYREITPLGLILDALGIAIFALGLYRLL